MAYIERIAFSALLLTCAACGPDAVSDRPTTHCLSLKAPEGGISASAPARISLFFTVDTCGGEPVPALGSDAFQITEDGSPVSPLESQQTIQAKGQKYRMDSLLLLDMSGSMLRSGEFQTLRDAAGHYVSQVLSSGAGQQVALMTFDGREQPVQVSDFTADEAQLQHALDSLMVTECSSSSDCAGYADRRTCAAFRCVDDSTNLNGALVAGINTLESRLAVADGLKFKDAALVAFTDGSDQADRVSQDAALSRVTDTKVKVITVGLGAEIDAAALVAFGKDGSFPASKAADLDAAFAQAAQRVTGEANKSYLLEYCSPRRSGHHQLRVSASATTSEGPMTGSFSGSFDATGFTSGCAL